MAFVGVRALSREISKTLNALEQGGEPVIITNHGRPIAALVAVDQHNLEDLVLAAAPEAARRRRAAGDAIAEGRGTRLADLREDEAGQRADVTSLDHREAIVAQLKPVHAELLGWEPSEEVLASAVESVGESVSALVEAIDPDGEKTELVARRVEQLNTDLYTRLWTHCFREAVEDRLEEMTRDPGQVRGGLADEAVARRAVENAAHQLRAINAPLVALKVNSIGAYEACLTTLAHFDEMAHTHTPELVTAEVGS